MPVTAKGTQQQQDGQPHSPPRPAPGAQWQPTAQDKADLGAIDAALDRMRALTASDPYVLTIPQDVEPRYHHSYRAQAQQWLSNTPFSANEHESLQYQTFFFHEHGKQMYVLQNSQPQEPRAAATAAGDNKPPPGTGANTPTVGPKKKITLDAYKKKLGAAPTTPEAVSATKSSDATAAKQAALKGPIERVKAETEEMLAAVADSDAPEPVAQVPEALPEKKDLKRKREMQAAVPQEENGLQSQKHADARTRKTDAPPMKKARRSPSPPIGAADPAVKPVKASSQAPHEPPSQSKEYDETKLPPRLSPGMPPRLSPLRHPRSPETKQDDPTPTLPSMLSPTLPENIHNTLKARDVYHAGSKEDKLTKKAEDTAKRKSPMPRNGFRANSSSPAVRSDAEEKPRLVANSAPQRARTPDVSHEDDDTDNLKRTRQGKETSSRLLVKIKYRKSQKEVIARILKMRPAAAVRPSSPASSGQPKEDDEDDVINARPRERRNGERNDEKTPKPVTQKLQPVKKEKKQMQPEDKATSASKRSVREEPRSEQPSKRRNPATSEARKEPSTPARSDLQSPAAPSSSQKNRLTATPSTRRDILSQAMKREFSQESATTHTPPALASTPGLNGHSWQSNGATRPPSSQPSSKTPKQHAWEIEQRRLEILGRELKHAATAHLGTQQPDNSAGGSTSDDQKLAAVKSLESLISYLLAFTCTDEAASSADPKQAPSAKPWRSLQGLHSFVKRTCEAYPPLCGLACALGITFNSRILAITAQFPPEPVDVEGLLVTTRALHRTAIDAEARLDVDALQLAFPRTWSQRSKQPKLSASPEAAEPAKLLSGPYKLPLGLVTPPFRAARAGYAMLREWVEKEGLEYNFKLNI